MSHSQKTIDYQDIKVAVVIPCYKVTKHIVELISRIGPEVSAIYVIDDCCPEGSGKLVIKKCPDPRIQVFFNAVNLGVGGSVIRGYQQALLSDMEIVLKLDGDGQMDPALIPEFIAPILLGLADYTKGNRFYNYEDVRKMPAGRLIGNGILSFVTKTSSGYWNIFDPTNGYTAIHRTALEHLPLKKLSNRYFFESDLLFRLNLMRAVVVDVSMPAVYGDEISNLNIANIIGPFIFGNSKNFFKRIFYNYFLRDFSVATLEMIAGILLLIFGVFFGVYQWSESIDSGIPASSGTVMLSGLPILVGMQLLLSALNFDVSNVPTIPLNLTKNALRRS